MNDKILKLANALYNNEECRNQMFELTLNYKDTIKHTFEDRNIIYPILNEEELERIKRELSKVKVKSFNLTVKFENGINHINLKYDIDWYSCNLAFFGEEKIQLSFDMLSPYCSFDDSSFNSTVGEPEISVDNLDTTIQKMVELKNTLLENSNRLINKLLEIKNL